MSPINVLRARLGPVKRVLFDEWPFRGRVKAIPAVRERFRPLLETLDPLQSKPPFVYEIHMLCGKRDLDMGIWASWSIMRFMDGRASLWVHSDGSLHAEDLVVWRRIVGEVVLVEREEGDRRVHESLADTAVHLYPWRTGNWASAQLVDMHFFGDAPAILIMDSDVLTFQRPVEVMNALTAARPGFAWCRDLRNAYSADPGLLRDITGVSMPERLCAGFMVCPRLNHGDFMELEAHLDAIHRDERIQLNHYWSCQTYYGLLASRRVGAGILPETYDNTAGRTGPRQVLRHFVGIPRVRFRYFSEGLPRVLHGGQGRSEFL